MTRKRKPTVELCVRSLGHSPSWEEREEAIAKLQSLESKGAIADYTVNIYGTGTISGTSSSRTAVGMRLDHRVLILRQWAAINQGSHDHFFAVRDGPTYDAELRDSYVFPPMVLLEFDSTRLAFASPFEKAKRVYSVDEHLDAIDPDSETILVARQTAVDIEDPLRTAQANVPDLGPNEAQEASWARQ